MIVNSLDIKRFIEENYKDELDIAFENKLNLAIKEGKERLINEGKAIVEKLEEQKSKLEKEILTKNSELSKLSEMLHESKVLESNLSELNEVLSIARENHKPLLEGEAIEILGCILKECLAESNISKEMILHTRKQIDSVSANEVIVEFSDKLEVLVSKDRSIFGCRIRFTPELNIGQARIIMGKSIMFIDKSKRITAVKDNLHRIIDEI